MDDSRIDNITELKKFLESSQKVSIRLATIDEKYTFIQGAVKKYRYKKLAKHEKKVVLFYLKKITGFKKTQMHKLIARALIGKLVRKVYVRTNPHLVYKAYDIKLLEKTDALHLRLNGLATKEILRRECEVFGNKEFENIARVSPSHITNLRHTEVYKNSWVNQTKPSLVNIAVTAPPVTNGIPGSIRVDTVSQNDIYHINAVDEICQWELVASVPRIQEIFMEDVLYDILLQFPFAVFNFHSDRGSEYINYVICKLLNKLLIKQTKSRSRHCNDNALVESKNGTVVRKNFGYFYVNQDLCETLNKFHKEYFNLYLNYHRPCLFVTDTITYPNGRTRDVYNEATTPYEKLKEICNRPENKDKKILRDDMTFEKLDKIAYAMSDNAFAKLMRKEQERIHNINKDLGIAP